MAPMSNPAPAMRATISLVNAKLGLTRALIDTMAQWHGIWISATSNSPGCARR